jgi:hypothetical protein
MQKKMGLSQQQAPDQGSEQEKHVGEPTMTKERTTPALT